MGDLSWAAGLFEGEGSVTSSRGRRRLSLRMTREETVRRFHVETGCGTVYGPYKNGLRRQDVFMWVAVGDEAVALVERLYPLVSPWRREAMEQLFPDAVPQLERVA